MTATTALTAQNTLGVQDVFAVPPTFIRQQIKACFDDIGVDIVKTGELSGCSDVGPTGLADWPSKGMMASGPTIQAVAEILGEHEATRVVVDPVCQRISGRLLELRKEAQRLK